MTNEELSAEVQELRERLSEQSAAIDKLMANHIWRTAQWRQVTKLLGQIAVGVATTDADKACARNFDAILDGGARRDLAEYLLAIGDREPAIAEHLRRVLEQHKITPDGFGFHAYGSPM